MSWIRWYPFVAPVLLTPASLYLWWMTSTNWLVVGVAWAVPIAWAYIVPGLGTNVFKVWAFNTRWKLGRFRWHHGFVFGSATAMLVWLISPQGVRSAWGVVQLAFIEACVLGSINYLYDVKAIKLGILSVYNQPAAEGQPAEVIAMDYAPWFFGGFGAVHGACLGGAMLFATQVQTPVAVLTWSVLALLLCIGLPVLGFMWQSWRVHGHPGLRPIAAPGHGQRD